jgi:hypothetical protein
MCNFTVYLACLAILTLLANSLSHRATVLVKVPAKKSAQYRRRSP